ncbi:mRNA-decapping enzyme 2 [Plasmodium gonderi]|uniref:mRNA-decapping enzyme 2 n=1 Tax=Plasmodium gonderi TaxID=77519 RepID=A0A1Y1JPZ8_PLAGO|nr:mRNA-decapping enzyme 2 [Plasmodium gonderi]GAW83297.1 mRNA-decapping enzyme 2 [Plasmodium gonderi]
MNLIKGTKNKMKKNLQNKHLNNSTKCKKVFSAHRIKQLAKDKKLLDDALLDCYGRFIALLPEFLLKDHVHLYFQIQEAYWWYDDMWQEKYPDKLPKLSLKIFGYLICDDCPILKKYVPPSAHEKFSLNWRRYCRTIPLRGAILLNHNLKKCLLVKGWSTDSWSFPKGKVDELEEDSVCACREIYEEIGIDIFPYIDEQVYIETHIEDQPIKLFIIPGVKEETNFQPKTRKEIGAIRWFEIEKLLEYINSKNKKSILFENKKERINEWFVGPFIPNLIKWIEILRKSVHAKKLKEGNSYLSGGIQAYKYQISGVEEDIIKKLQIVNLNSKEIINIGLFKSDDDLEECYDENEKLLIEMNEEICIQEEEDLRSNSNYDSVMDSPIEEKNRVAFTKNRVRKDSNPIPNNGDNKMINNINIGPNVEHCNAYKHMKQQMVAKKVEENKKTDMPLHCSTDCKDFRKNMMNSLLKESAYAAENTYNKIGIESIGNKKVYEHVDDSIVPLRRTDILRSSFVLSPEPANLNEVLGENIYSADVEKNCNRNSLRSTYNKTIRINSSNSKNMKNETHKIISCGNDSYHQDEYEEAEKYCSSIIKDVNSGAGKILPKQINLMVNNQNKKISISSSGSSNNKVVYHGKNNNVYNKTYNGYNSYRNYYVEFDESGTKGHRYGFNKMRMGGHLSALRLKEVGLRSFDDQDMDRRKNFHLQVYGSKGKWNNDKKEIQNKHKKRNMKNSHHSLDDSSVHYIPTKNKKLDACNDKTFGQNHTNGWSAEDMFKLNEEKFGIQSTYNIEEYTTPLLYNEEKTNKYMKNTLVKNTFSPYLIGNNNNKGSDYTIKISGVSEKTNIDEGIICGKSSINNNDRNEKKIFMQSKKENYEQNEKLNMKMNMDIPTNSNTLLMNGKNLKDILDNTKKSISSVSSNRSSSSRGGGGGNSFFENGLVKNTDTTGVNYIKGYNIHCEPNRDTISKGGRKMDNFVGPSHVNNLNRINCINDTTNKLISRSKNSNMNFIPDVIHTEERDEKTNTLSKSIAGVDAKTSDHLKSYKMKDGSSSSSSATQNRLNDGSCLGTTNNIKPWDENLSMGNVNEKEIENCFDLHKNEFVYNQMRSKQGYENNVKESSSNVNILNEYLKSPDYKDPKMKIILDDVNYKNSSTSYDMGYINTIKENNSTSKLNKSKYGNNTNVNTKYNEMYESDIEYRNTLNTSYKEIANVKNILTKTYIRMNKETSEKREYNDLDYKKTDHYENNQNGNISANITDKISNNNNSNSNSNSTNEPGKYLLNLIKGTGKLEMATTIPNSMKNNQNKINWTNAVSENNVKALSEKEILSKFYNNEINNNIFMNNINTSQSSLKCKKNSFNNDEKYDIYKNVISKENIKIENNRNRRRNVENFIYDGSNRSNLLEEKNFNEMEMMEKLSKHLNSYNPFE